MQFHSHYSIHIQVHNKAQLRPGENVLHVHNIVLVKRYKLGRQERSERNGTEHGTNGSGGSSGRKHVYRLAFPDQRLKPLFLLLPPA